MHVTSLAVAAQAGSWATREVALGFGLPIAVVLVGLTIYLGGRTERRALKADDGQQGGFGGPPGSTDVGDAEGFGVEGKRAMILAASRKVLIGLFVMLAGLLALLVSTLSRFLT